MRLMVFFLLTNTLMSCNAITTDLSILDRAIPEKFDFVLNYGVGGKNQIDTFNGRYTKDLINEGVITTNFKLTAQDMESIYKKMQTINIMTSKTVKLEQKNRICLVSPLQSYELKVQIGSKLKQLSWTNLPWWTNGNHCSLTNDQQELIELVNFIHSVVTTKDEYKKLPEPEGGYE